MIKTGNMYLWFSDGGDYNLRLDYDLNENSVVFDLGGYKGEWTQKIFDKYSCTIYVFEPIKNLYNDIVKKFEGNDKIKIFNFAISDVNEKRFISLKDDASSFYKTSEDELECEVVSISDFLSNEKINNIDLIKINVEGDEYKIMKKILSDGLINIFKNLQIQFHEFYPNAHQIRSEIQSQLSKTHSLTYNYEFVWENWEKNKK